MTWWFQSLEDDDDSSLGIILPPSPAKAKQLYLKSQKGLVFHPQAKIVQMNKELDIVREWAAAKLDKDINKSVYRKLMDPLQRYKHSVINLVELSL
jgi:hypothetical protein